MGGNLSRFLFKWQDFFRTVLLDFLQHGGQEGGEADVVVLGAGGEVDDDREDGPTEAHFEPLHTSGELINEGLHGLLFFRGLRRGHSGATHHHHLFSSHLDERENNNKQEKKKVRATLPRSRAKKGWLNLGA